MMMGRERLAVGHLFVLLAIVLIPTSLQGSSYALPKAPRARFVATAPDARVAIAGSPESRELEAAWHTSSTTGPLRMSGGGAGSVGEEEAPRRPISARRMPGVIRVGGGGGARTRELEVGSKVRIKGLSRAKEYNGMLGMVTEKIKDRYSVEVLGLAEELVLKGENLESVGEAKKGKQQGGGDMAGEEAEREVQAMYEQPAFQRKGWREAAEYVVVEKRLSVARVPQSVRERRRVKGGARQGGGDGALGGGVPEEQQEGGEVDGGGGGCRWRILSRGGEWG